MFELGGVELERVHCTFDLQFLYELKHMVFLSETVCSVFHFRFRFIFIKVYSFVRQNAWTPLL